MKHILSKSIRAVLLTGALATLPLAALAANASASDLLERGIYTEETKGDIDGAIAIYQQLITEARNSQSLAAQAQFRLGQCLLKKNRTAEATAAFEKLTRDYPDEKDLVAKARQFLPADLEIGPVPWKDGERLEFTINTATGIDIGTAAYHADRDQVDGREVWRVGTRIFAGNNGSYSTVTVDAADFHPLSSRWKHDLLGEATAVYSPTEVKIQQSNKPDPITTHVDKPVYDNEEAVHLIRRLPLKVGYKGAINILTSLGGGVVIPIAIDVPVKEVVKVPAGEFNCFKVNLSVMQTFWYSDDEQRTLVKFEGGGITANLSSIRYQTSGQPVQLNDEKLGVSLSAPPDWIIHVRESGDGAGTQSIYMLDPVGDIDGAQIRLVSTTSLAAGSSQTARAWAEAAFAQSAKAMQNAKIRQDSWQTLLVSGRPAVGYVADYTDKGRPMQMYAVHSLGAQRSETFMFMCQADKFAANKPAFDSIVKSYRVR